MTATTTITTLTNTELDLSKIQNQAQMLSSDSKGATEGKTTENAEDALRQSATQMTGTTYTANATDEAVTADGIYTVNGASIDADGTAVTAVPAEMIGKTVTLDGDQLTRLIGATEADGIAKADGQSELVGAKPWPPRNTLTDIFGTSETTTSADMAGSGCNADVTLKADGQSELVGTSYSESEEDSLTQRYGTYKSITQYELIGDSSTTKTNSLTDFYDASIKTSSANMAGSGWKVNGNLTADGKFTTNVVNEALTTVTQKATDYTDSTWTTFDANELAASTASWVTCSNDFAGVTDMAGKVTKDIVNIYTTANFDGNMFSCLR